MDVASGVASFLFHLKDIFTCVEISLGSQRINLHVCVAQLWKCNWLVSFALTQVLFFLNTHQIFCVGVKVSARNCKVSIQSGCMCLGILPVMIAKISKPETSGTAGLMIHRWKLLEMCGFYLCQQGVFPLVPIFCRWSI